MHAWPLLHPHLPTTILLTATYNENIGSVITKKMIILFKNMIVQTEMHLREDQHSNPQQQGISHQAPEPPGLDALRLLPSLCVLQFHYLEKLVKTYTSQNLKKVSRTFGLHQKNLYFHNCVMANACTIVQMKSACVIAFRVRDDLYSFNCLRN
jgi:hypothetical protein